MPFSKPLYFDNILHKKASSSRRTITKYIVDLCDDPNKSLLDVIDQNRIISEINFNRPSARQIAEVSSADLKRQARNTNDYFACRLSRPCSTVFSDSSIKPFIISYCGRLCTGSSLTAMDTKHEVNPHNPSYFSPYSYLETVVLPSDHDTAGLLSYLTSHNSTLDISTFGKLYATPISERMHLPFEYSDETSSYERPTLCSCLIADAIVLVYRARPPASIQVFHIKNNVISHRYTFDIPQKEETPQTPRHTSNDAASILAQFERFTSAVSQGIALNQDACSDLLPDVCYVNTTSSN